MRREGGGGSGNFGIATMPRVKSDPKYTVWRDFAVGGCAKFQIFRIYYSFWTLHAWFWKTLEHFLLFTEIPTEKILQRQIYVQNIQYDVLLRKGEGGSILVFSDALYITHPTHPPCIFTDFYARMHACIPCMYGGSRPDSERTHPPTQRNGKNIPVGRWTLPAGKRIQSRCVLPATVLLHM